MSLREELIETFCLEDESLLFLEPASLFDKHIIGVTTNRWQSDAVPVLVYDEEGIIESLIEEEGLTYEEASEHLSFNIVGSYVGPQTPVFVQRFDVKTSL